MDKSVVDSYGWPTSDLGYDFHITKQGVRFTLAVEARQDVLDRLLKLNHERYAAEVAADECEEGKKQKKSPKKRMAQAPTLF
jgi:hypothetical protein